jgi:hypothetical protein
MSLIEKVTVEVLHDERRLFRVCANPDSEAMKITFRSHYELRRPPRGPENRAAVIHMALSMFDRPEIAADLARRVPKLGGYVATMDLVPGMGICVAKTGAPAHWSVWGRPAQLATCVNDVANIGA